MAKPSLLIVIRDEVVRNTYGNYFSKDGYRVQLIDDGEKAIVAAKNGLPDIIILDGILPGVDGFDVCRELKNNERTKRIKIILNSARIQKKDIQNGLNAGADLYVTWAHDWRMIRNIIEDAANNPDFPSEEIKNLKAVHTRN